MEMPLLSFLSGYRFELADGDRSGCAVQRDSSTIGDLSSGSLDPEHSGYAVLTCNDRGVREHSARFGDNPGGDGE